MPINNEETMISVDNNLLIRTMKSSSSSSTISKPTSNKNLKWRWNKIKDKIKSKHSYDNNSMQTGDTETMITKTTMDDDDACHSIVNDMSFCSRSTASMSYNNVIISDHEESTTEYLKIMETPIIPNDKRKDHVEHGIKLSQSKSVDFMEEDNTSKSSSENNLVLYNDDDNKVLPLNASEIFSYSNETESYTEESTCDYRYIKRTKSFIGSEVFSICGNSAPNACVDDSALAIESGDVITTYDDTTIAMKPNRFRFSSGDFKWNFNTPTAQVEVSNKSLLDVEEDEEEEDVQFLPVQDDCNVSKRKRNYYPLVAVASNRDGGIEAVNFDDSSYRVSASVEEMDSYDQNDVVEEQASLQFQNSSFFNCGLDFCNFK